MNKTGHFNFAENRTFLLCLDSLQVFCIYRNKTASSELVGKLLCLNAIYCKTLKKKINELTLLLFNNSL